MREFNIVRGKYKGKYIIYDSKDEYIKLTGKVPKSYLEDNPEDFEVGEYLIVNDGAVVPLLGKHVIKNKDKSIKSYLLKFPNGMASIYRRNDNSYYRSKFYGFYTNVDTYSFSKRTPLQRTMLKSGKKELFAKLIATGTPINIAAKLAYPELFKFSTLATIKSKIIMLLNDEEVITMIKETYNEFMEKLNKDPDFSDEALIEYIKSFIKNVRKGSQTHLNSILPLLKLTGKIEPDFNTNNKKIEDINYEELPPEQLPPVSEK